MTQVRTVDGRIAGRRGQETRARLLECLAELLAARSYRDVTVIDVARDAGTSPATFYQYFPDIEAAILELAAEVVKEAAELKELAAERSWAGRAGTVSAAELVNGLMDFWQQHDSILRVVDLAAAEGDKRFARHRMKVLDAVHKALSSAVTELQQSGKVERDVPAAATAGALVTMLAAAAAHPKSFESWSVKEKDLRNALIRLVAWGVTGKKPAV
ncbi:MAG TPA: TetR family transcriptional regulator [Actinospica sp.]|nr:TetR family transcriptional regulator [Actinospica sp.]